MPKARHVNLLTFHAYASWLPDRKQGYFENKSGLREQNQNEADWYRKLQREDPVELLGQLQRCLIDACRAAATHLRVTLHGVATDPSHLHVLASWDHEREPRDIRRSLKHGLSAALNADFAQRQWFGRGGHDRRVRDREHFLYLRDQYLPDHPGQRWDRRIGYYVEKSLAHLRLP